MSAGLSQYETRQWVTVPNVITLIRLLLGVPIAIFIIQDLYPAWTVALLVGFGASDWVDGYLARKLGQTSLVGSLLDPIADRVGVGIIVCALVVAGHLQLGLIVAIAATDIALAFAYLLSHSPCIPSVSTLGKIRTAFLMTGLAVTSLSLLPTFEALAYFGTVLCGIGTGLHLLAGLGYLRAMAHCSRRRRATAVHEADL